MPKDNTDMAHWWPVVRDLPGINAPKTILIPADHAELMSIMDGEASDEFKRLVACIERAAAEIGLPCFLRTGYTSGKHEWRRTCALQDVSRIGWHVGAIIQFSECAGILGLPYDLWVVREMLPTEAAFHAFDGMPVTTEFRFAVRDGKVERWQPYWPPSAIRKPDVDDWQDRLRVLNAMSTEDERMLTSMAEAVGAALLGFWSVDFLWAGGKWWLIDMTEGDKSFWWDGDFDADLEGMDDA